MQKDERVAAELGAFRAAVTQRFEDEGVRQMLRTGAVNVPSVALEQQPSVDRVTELTAILRQGERAVASLAQCQAESEGQALRGCGCECHYAANDSLASDMANNPMFASPQVFSAMSTGSIVRPNGERLYSTLGGT